MNTPNDMQLIGCAVLVVVAYVAWCCAYKLIAGGWHESKPTLEDGDPEAIE